MTVRLYLPHVKRIYDKKVAAGLLLREGDLDGAVNAPFQDVFGRVVCQTMAHKAGKLLDGIQRVQAYSDGNKRLAWHSTVAFLALNGHELVHVPDNEVDEFVRGLVGHGDADVQAAQWLNDRMRRLP